MSLNGTEDSIINVKKFSARELDLSFEPIHFHLLNTKITSQNNIMLTLLVTSSQLFLTSRLELAFGVRMCPKVFRCRKDSRQCLENTPKGNEYLFGWNCLKLISFRLELLKIELRRYVSCFIIDNGSVL